MTLGECINNYLNEHKMSMRKFASLAGVSHAYISNIVNGKTSRGNNPVPSIDVYRGVAKAMGISVETLISMVDDKIAWGERKKEPILITKDGHEIDEVEFNALVYAITHELSPELYPKFKQFVELAADNPNSAERFLSFAVQELESSKQSH